MSKKLKVAVLMGGKSPEYDISLLSGREVVKNLDKKKYDVLPIVVSRDDISFQLNNKIYPLGQLSAVYPEFTLKVHPEEQSRRVNCQLFFIAMHGPYGEDGTVQGFLDLIGIPYTGSGVLASALGMDKIYSRKLFTQSGLNVPKWLTLGRKDNSNVVWEKLKPPLFVKPSNQGSSVGVSKVNSKKGLTPALKKAFKYSRLALVEQAIEGMEVTSAILGNEKPIALPLVEIVPKTEFFDYKAKYNELKCDKICPARISKHITKEVQSAALVAYQVLGCRGFGRVDMIIKDNKVYVLEVNTIPGLTSVSLLPKAAKAAGISYLKLLDKIISYAIP